MLESHININDFDYNLPDNKIAKYPLEQRDNAKLLIYNKINFSTDYFYNIPDYFSDKDLIIFNDTKVINARLIFEKETGSKIEIFCLEPLMPADYYTNFAQNQKCKWKCLVGNNKKWKTEILTKKICINNEETVLIAKKIAVFQKSFGIFFEWNNQNITFSQILENYGQIPIPPYLNRDSESIDNTEYQTIYSHFAGSVAAPTAGLHFTDAVFEKLQQKNVSKDFVTLHIGAGTFQPVKTENALEHTMHAEIFVISKHTINNIIQHYGNICAVGTTTVRTLETVYQIAVKVLKNNELNTNYFTVSQFEVYENKAEDSPLKILENLLTWMENNNFTELHCSTQIMLFPSYKFKIINKLITNFHQPKSTLLLLLAAFIGDKWKDMYSFALKNDFRFLSYGDACLV